jgi:UDP-N-acetylglucosamine--N-acetylmuramyl-(pentapeptide) pyrophosphoryl-undecaprenol N-acetylglucosamine transferase
VRILSRGAAAVAVSFAATVAQLPGARTVLTGNPVRADFNGLEPRPAGESPPYVLLVTGGSQGARRLNFAVADALPRLLEQAPLRVVHLCGQLDLPELEVRRARLEPALAERWELSAFRSDMAALISQSDLVVSRAGGSTVAELTALGRPALYVPYPSAGAHQDQNADAVVAGGAGLMLSDEECDGERILAEVLGLLRDPERLQEMGRAARALGRPGAADELAGLLRTVATEHEHA